MSFPALPPLTLSGLADEAADDLAGQVGVQRELGWSAIELRLIAGKQTSWELTDDEFARAADTLAAAGLRVTAFASALGNWSRPITGDFAIDAAELRAAIPRLQRVGAKFIRGMSWVGAGVEADTWRDEAVRRYRELGAIAADGGVVVLHENCEGWGGLSPAHAVEFHERVNHPGVGVLFDIGNTVAYGLGAWEFYAAVKPFIQHVHVKDAKRNPAGGKSAAFTLPGEGGAEVRRILADLLRSGYRGAIAIEPHVASMIHAGAPQATPAMRRESYARYGRAFTAMIASLRAELSI
jgi:sugar phosphate isomerase/epimerase